MLIPRHELITSVINENKGKTKLLDEWQQIINKALPTPKRMTKRSLNHVIINMSKSGAFVLVRETVQRNTFYKFE